MEGRAVSLSARGSYQSDSHVNMLCNICALQAILAPPVPLSGIKTTVLPYFTVSMSIS